MVRDVLFVAVLCDHVLQIDNSDETPRWVLCGKIRKLDTRILGIKQFVLVLHLLDL